MSFVAVARPCSRLRTMKMILTPRQREIWELAGRLADTFAERAQTFDRENRFPFENYEELSGSGYLRLTVPEELGGLGASLYETVLAQERLAQGDGSTALAVNMHVSPIGQWAGIWRETKDTGLEQLLRDVAAGKVVWASLTSEPGVQNTMSNSNTMVERVDGGWKANGYKIFCTNSEVATHFSFNTRWEEAPGGPRVMVFRTAKDAPGLEFVRTWDTLGMRGTQSNDLKITDLFVPDDALVHSLPVDHLDARVLKTQYVWGVATFGAVYLGVAAGAIEWAREVVKKRGRHVDPLVQEHFAKMEILLESARAVLKYHADTVDDGSLYEQMTVQEAFSRAGLSKYVPCNNALEIMHLIIDAAGGPTFMRKQPFERMFRDVQGGVIMPMTNFQAYRMLGMTALGLEVAPVIDYDESGTDSRSPVRAPESAFTP
jgi:alkylation response protein AidB-like acyl-CoA dehydrogenase